MKEITDKLMKLKDVKYQEFQSKLVPNIDKNKILGIKTPDLRMLAKEIASSDMKEEFLKELPHQYYDEDLIHFFVISLEKDFNKTIEYVETFLPYVNCWPVSDQATPKAFNKHHQELLPYIKKWIASSHVYTARFGMRILMNEFLDDDFKEEYLELVASKKGEDYYLKMMVAWYFATALCKQYDASIKYIEEHRLDDWVHKKTIQKAIDSFRVTEEHKEYLRSLK